MDYIVHLYMETDINSKVNMPEGIEENHETPQNSQTMARVGLETF
jgi:hypothetical protein